MDQTAHATSEIKDSATSEIKDSSRPKDMSNGKYRLLEIPVVGTSKVFKVCVWPTEFNRPGGSGDILNDIPKLLRSLEYLEYQSPQPRKILVPVVEEESSGGSAPQSSSGPWPIRMFQTIDTGIEKAPVPKLGYGHLSFDKSVYEDMQVSPGVFAEQVSSILGLSETNCTHPSTSVKNFREDLKRYEMMFKSQYIYRPKEEGVCIMRRSVFPWMRKSSGIMWAGVYGINATCVVTLSGHVEWKRVHGSLAYGRDSKTLLYVFRKCLLSELEDLADPSSKLREKFPGGFDIPFCVVSETPGTAESGHEGFCLNV